LARLGGPGSEQRADAAARRHQHASRVDTTRDQLLLENRRRDDDDGGLAQREFLGLSVDFWIERRRAAQRLADQRAGAAVLGDVRNTKALTDLGAD
jgi:hypothetical protein